jgi:GntR family transcriptional repressor for pyruvate dehydrogenase complex
LKDLYDIRIDIEVASAKAAAVNRSDAQLVAIAACLSSTKGSDGQHAYHVQGDLRFHLAIAQATDNFLRLHIIKETFDIASSQIHRALETITAVQGNIDAIHDQHARIYQAIADKNRPAAGAAMHHHLQWVKSELNTFL